VADSVERSVAGGGAPLCASIGMRNIILEHDFRSGLALLRDTSDPPRYYVKQGHRLELIAIGNERAARSRFAVRCSRRRRELATPSAPRIHSGEISLLRNQGAAPRGAHESGAPHDVLGAAKNAQAG